MTNNPELMTEISKLAGRLQHELHYPPARTESRLLPLLPESTLVYGASSNYGDVLHQALTIFQQELQESAALRDWWQRNGGAVAGAKVQDCLEQVYQLSQYVGDEIVVSGRAEGVQPKFAMFAEVRKPGLKDALLQTLSASGAKPKDVLILSQQDLPNAKPASENNVFVLLRNDYVVAAFDLNTIRLLNASLDKHQRNFASSAFGQRAQKAYEGGVTTVAAVDLHDILNLLPMKATDPGEQTLEKSGFADMKYWVWRRTAPSGQSLSETELSFSGPRKGVAAWLAAPGPMHSLDFVSPNAIMVASALFTNPAYMFDDVKQIASVTNPRPFAGLEAFETMLNLSLRDDVLDRLGGEVTVELDGVAPPQPTWRVILRAKDANGLQAALNTLLTAMHIEAQSSDEGGITYHTVSVPSPQTTLNITYAFVDDYWIVASSRDGAADAVRMHRNGGGLGQSTKFVATLPPGHANGLSALFYEDPVAMGALQLQRFAPQMAESLSQLTGKQNPVAMGIYADDTAIREQSTNAAFDAGGVLVAAAIAIPNLLRSRMAANEASAVGSMRSVLTAEIAYAATYPQRAFASDLATLGPGDSSATAPPTPDHANLLDASLAGPSCKASAWCTKSGYRFRLTAECKQKLCTEFVVVATPASGETGARSFCSTSDGVIRFKADPNPGVPKNAAECRAWAPLNGGSASPKEAAPERLPSAQTRTN